MMEQAILLYPYLKNNFDHKLFKQSTKILVVDIINFKDKNISLNTEIYIQALEHLKKLRKLVTEES